MMARKAKRRVIQAASLWLITVATVAVWRTVQDYAREKHVIYFAIVQPTGSMSIRTAAKRKSAIAKKSEGWRTWR